MIHKIHQTEAMKLAESSNQSATLLESANQKLDEVKQAIQNIPEVNIPESKDFPEFPTEMAVSLKGVSVVTIKGDKGDSPKKEELLELIKPLIPEPIKGQDADNDRILEELTKRIPEPLTGKPGDKGKKGDPGKDGKTPVKNIDYFDGLPGKDGIDKEPETTETIAEKINSKNNHINFQVLTNIPDFALARDINMASGAGGGQTLTFQDEGIRITDNPITTLNVTGATGALIYSGSGVATLDITANLTGYLQNNLGIAGSTTLIGGTAASETLTLQSTSNATKGKILFGTSAYDEVNNRLGLGVATPTSTLEVNGNITLSAGANRIINVTDATSTSGNALTVKSASGANSVGNSISNAGAMFILSGNGGSNTSYTGTSNAPDGGVINVTSGNGGSFSGASPHAGGGSSGQINITSGIPGTGITSNGQSGMVQIKTGAGISGVSQSLGGGATGSIYMQPGDGGTAAPGNVGGNGGYIISTSGVGGTSIVSSAGTNTGGVSGNLAMTVASAGQANAGSINVGGNAGAMTFSGGAGGFGGNTVLVSTSTGGNGSSGTFTGGNGGYAKTSTANNRTTTGGAGGSFTFTGGTGGLATNGSVATAGNAGNIYFNAGAGGAATGGNSNVGKTGGSLNFNGGSGGAGGNTNGGSMYFKGGEPSGAGLHGNIILGMNSAGVIAGNVGIGTTSPTAVLHLKASTASVNTGALKFTAGVVATTPEAGLIEFDGTSWYLNV